MRIGKLQKPLTTTQSYEELERIAIIQEGCGSLALGIRWSYEQAEQEHRRQIEAAKPQQLNLL